MTERQKRKVYNKMNKKYYRELRDLIKRYGPWDNYLWLFFKIQVRHWIEYYTLGYNVNCQEIKDDPKAHKPNHPTRLEIATELKRLFDEWDNFLSGEIDFENFDIKEIDKEYKAKRSKFMNYLMKYQGEMWD